MNYNQTSQIIEMMIHVPLCVHPQISKVALFGAFKNDEFILKELRHYPAIDFQIFSADDISELKSKLLENGFRDKNIDTNFDVIICFEPFSDTKMDQFLSQMLTPKGIAVVRARSINLDFVGLKEDLVNAAKDFIIAMPFNFANNQSAIFLSKKYHPTADLILDKSDFLEDLTYYTSEIHNASFVLNATQNKELLGIAKR